MRVTTAYLFGLALVAGGVAPPVATAQKDGDPFQGTWELVKFQLHGKDLTGFLKDSNPTITFKGDWYAFAVGPASEKGTYTFDPKAKPATIDLKIVEGNGKGKTQLGIYKVEGDTLELCLADEGAKERPTKFASAKDAPEMVLFTLKRKKAEKKVD